MNIYIRHLLIITFIIFSVSAYSEIPKYCQADDVFHIKRPYQSFASSSETFSYFFKHMKTTVPNATTFIYLPGGPGGDSIERGNRLKLPSQFNIIFIDPRGVGCNGELKESLPEDFFSTENLSDDVLAIIKELSLDKYIIYGSSYGTVWGTVVASKAKKYGLPSPKAVLFSGTTGKVISDPYLGLQREWENLKQKLPINIVNLLSKANPPLQLPGKYWGSYIISHLSSGLTGLYKKLLLLDGTAEDKKKLKYEVKYVGEFTYPSKKEVTLKDRLYKDIWCSELGSTDNTDLELVSGELVGPIFPDFCEGVSMSNPFDSALWPIDAPIYYFQGGHDPLTYMELAKYHYYNQTGEKYFVINPSAGHSPFSSVKNCMNKIFSLIDSHSPDFKQEIEACSDDLVVTMQTD